MATLYPLYPLSNALSFPFGFIPKTYLLFPFAYPFSHALSWLYNPFEQWLYINFALPFALTYPLSLLILYLVLLIYPSSVFSGCIVYLCILSSTYTGYSLPGNLFLCLFPVVAFTVVGCMISFVVVFVFVLAIMLWIVCYMLLVYALCSLALCFTLYRFVLSLVLYNLHLVYPLQSVSLSLLWLGLAILF